MLAAPLMAGNDLRTMSDDVREILKAPELIAVDQDPAGRQARRIRHDGDVDVWMRELADGRRALAVLNRGPDDHDVRIALADIGVEPSTNVRVRDLWQQSDVGERRREIVAATHANSATVLGIAPQ
jgi:alpha-galactosidase